MPNILVNHNGVPFQQIQMQAALNQIKAEIENAILIGGTKAKNVLIRTQKPIRLIHDAVKTEVLNSGVHPSLINPSPKYLKRIINPRSRIFKQTVDLEDKELELAGFFMRKRQDISIVCDNILISNGVLTSPTELLGQSDIFGALFTESVLSINIRSQLSSTDKNKGTLYERAIAEALNFHKRFPKMVLSEVYLIIAKEYDEDAAKLNTVAFKQSDNIERYIKRFQAINSRSGVNDELYKYERCCLLVVDFDRAVPKIYNTTNELIQDGFLPIGTTVSMTGLDYSNFVTDIFQVYNARFPANTFI